MNRFNLSRRHQTGKKRPARARPVLELLEDRTVLSNYTAATVADLIADINAANSAGGSNTITLAPNTTFDITSVNNTTNGPNGLPVIAAGNNLSIVGQEGDIIQRDPSTRPQVGFRLLCVAGGGRLALSQVTLQYGGSTGSSSSDPGQGGAIYNQGTLLLSGVVVTQNNVGGDGAAGGGIWSSGTLTLESGTSITLNYAQGGLRAASKGDGSDAFGGGIWSSGTLTLNPGTSVQDNHSQGGGGAVNTPGKGGNAFGGGLYIAGGTASLTDATVSNNTAIGGDGAWTTKPAPWGRPTGSGGDGYGGGLYAAAGSSVTLRGDAVQSNTASGGRGKGSGTGYGGGVFIANKAAVYLDAVTPANTVNNTDSSGTNGSTANIDGSYTIITQGAVKRAKVLGTVSTH
jgi:hypothetical protein